MCLALNAVSELKFFRKTLLVVMASAEAVFKELADSYKLGQYQGCVFQAIPLDAAT